MHAYDSGLKGVTIYRDGCRSGVLVNTDTKKSDKFEYHDAPKRPKELFAEAFIVSVKGEKFNVIVGLLDDKPYEVFAFPSCGIKGEGLIIKQKKGEYDFIQLTDSNSTHRVLSDSMSDEQAIICRMLSYGLRHGGDVAFAVEQLNKSNGDITSFGKAISRTLKKYVSTERLIEKAKCENCGDNSNIIMEEGCLSCKSCGSSKCG